MSETLDQVLADAGFKTCQGPSTHTSRTVSLRRAMSPPLRLESRGYTRRVAYRVLFASPRVPEIIYGLADPREPERVRYVGRTANPQTRYESHCRSRCAARLRTWIAELSSAGVTPSMVLLEVCGVREATTKPGAVSVREEFWIASLRKSGGADLNIRWSANGRAIP